MTNNYENHTSHIDPVKKRINQRLGFGCDFELEQHFLRASPG
jgi:hypothetical protein